VPLRLRENQRRTAQEELTPASLKTQRRQEEQQPQQERKSWIRRSHELRTIFRNNTFGSLGLCVTSIETINPSDSPTPSRRTSLREKPTRSTSVQRASAAFSGKPSPRLCASAGKCCLDRRGIRRTVQLLVARRGAEAQRKAQQRVWCEASRDSWVLSSPAPCSDPFSLAKAQRAQRAQRVSWRSLRLCETHLSFALLLYCALHSTGSLTEARGTRRCGRTRSSW